MGTPALAAEPDGASTRPASWDMTQEELEAIGLGTLRDHPVPVPDHMPRRNVWTGPVAGGGAVAPWIIFTSFDGETVTEGMDSAQQNITQIDGFAGDYDPYGGDASMRTAIIQAVQTDFAEYNFSIVDERPESGEYSMTIVSPTNPAGPGILGRAPLDCANMQTHSNVSFAFHGANDGYNAVTVASTISHEQGHTFGLDHINEPAALLNPSDAGGDPSFIDQCIALTDGAGAFCADVHEQYCPAGSGQNSHLELLQTFGPAIPDIDPPIILITAPVNGATFPSGDGITVIADIIDDSPVLEAELYINGVFYQLDNLEPWGWPVNDLPDGLHTLEILAEDENGNQGLSTPVSILIGGDAGDGTGGETEGEDGPTAGGLDSGSGSSDGGETDSAGGNDDGDGGGCGCVAGSTPRAWWMAAPLGLVLVRRRRTRGHARA